MTAAASALGADQAAEPVRRTSTPKITAISGVEQSLVEQRFDRSLVQMATGAGKTFTAVTESYRLLKWGGFNGSFERRPHPIVD